MLKQILLGTAGILVAASLASTAAIARVIDDLTDMLVNGVTGNGDSLVSDNTNNGSGAFDRSVQILGTILGGDRELIVSKTSACGTINAEIIEPGYFTTVTRRSHQALRCCAGTATLQGLMAIRIVLIPIWAASAPALIWRGQETASISG